MSKEPVCLIIASSNIVNKIFIWISICIPLPQSVLPEPVNLKHLKKYNKLEVFKIELKQKINGKIDRVLL